MIKPLCIGPDGVDVEAAERYERSVNDMMDAERLRREARRRLDAEERGTIAWPEILTLQERLARPQAPTQFRIPQWLPVNGRVILAAQFKAGKTTLVGNLVRSLVDGVPFLGRDSVMALPGAVVIIDTEMSSAQLDVWLGAQGIKHADRVVLISMRGKTSAFDILDRDVRQKWARTLRDRRAAFLVLDCLRPVLDALGLDEHREAGRFLVALDALLDAANVSECLLTQHMGHSGERARGDSRLRDWPDVEWRLVRQDDDPASARFVSAFGRDVNVPESALLYDAATRHLTIAEGSRKEAKASELLGVVTEFLSEQKTPQSGRQIEAALTEAGHSRDKIRAALSAGIARGAIVPSPGPRRSILHSVRECAGVRE